MSNLIRSKQSAFEGELYGFEYNTYKLLETWEKLEKIGQKLSGLSSPRIKSEEEAKYKDPVRPAVDNIAELMTQEEEIRKQYDHYELVVNRVAKFLQSLTDEELDIIVKRYEQRRTLEDIAKGYYTSHRVILYKIKNIFSHVDF